MKSPQPPEIIPKPNLESIKGLILSDEQYTHHPFATTEGQRSYVYEFKKGSKHIFYFGSAHTNKTGDPLFTEIKTAFKTTRPQIVLVEGMEKINNRKDIVRKGGKNLSLEESMQYGESSYTLKLAIDAGIDFESPEPDLYLEIQMLLNSGYTKKDIFTFYIYRDIYQYQRENEIKNVENLEKFLEQHVKEFKIISGWSQEEVDNLLKELLSGIDLSSEKYEKETDPIPWEGHEQLTTNNISRASSDFRDRYIVGRITEILNKYDRVFVVYGASHAVKQEPAIKYLLS